MKMKSFFKGDRMYLNLGCGATRPADGLWVNIDNLHAVFPDKDCPERIAFDSEPHYKNADLTKGIPFEDNSADGIFASHFLEHLSAFNAIKFLKECRRVLKPEGVLRISVPDPEIFHRLTLSGCKDWGEPIPPSPSWMECALFCDMHDPSGHQMLLEKYSIFCLLWMADFRNYFESNFGQSTKPNLAVLDNRPVFSAFYEAVK
jgi:predicted SAM-dependent methyltransferase